MKKSFKNLKRHDGYENAVCALCACRKRREHAEATYCASLKRHGRDKYASVTACGRCRDAVRAL